MSTPPAVTISEPSARELHVDVASASGQERREHGRVIEVAPHRGLILTGDQQTVAGEKRHRVRGPGEGREPPDRLTGGDVEDMQVSGGVVGHGEKPPVVAHPQAETRDEAEGE